jgi:NtrC-family two-component system response regulator AlgB
MALATDFLAYFCKANHKKSFGFTDEAGDSFLTHVWSGNVRELRNTVERAVILGNDEKIGGQRFTRQHNPNHHHARNW